MNDKRSVLIIDSNVAFATMLREGLEQNGEYHAITTTSGQEALQALAAAEFDLVILDLGLTAPDGATFARMLRQKYPGLRLMLIPLMGEEFPPELGDLDIQGVLPKPFFFPELPGRIADALTRPVGKQTGAAEAPVAASAGAKAVEPGPAPEQPGVTTVLERISESRMSKVTQAMNTLAQEINAEAVILTWQGGLIAHTGRLSAEGATELAQIVAESWRNSARVAQILGQEQLRFEQSVEGGEHLFYSLAVAEDIILSAALRVSVPLGMIRHRAKATADKLRTLVGTG